MGKKKRREIGNEGELRPRRRPLRCVPDFRQAAPAVAEAEGGGGVWWSRSDGGSDGVASVGP